MNKKVLALCAIASISLAVFSCSKKDDDKQEETTSTTSTTATTATTSTTSSTSTTTPKPVIPTPGANQLAIDTTLFDYGVDNCLSIEQGRYQLKANQVDIFNNSFYATWGKAPNFSKEFTISTTLPQTNDGSQIQLMATIGSVTYIAQSGKVQFFKNMDSSGITFKELPFKGSNDSTKTLSGFLKCP